MVAAAAAVIMNHEINNGIFSEEPVSCSPDLTPPPFRRRTKRIPITSAIPLLPPVEQKHGPPIKPEAGKNGQPIKVYTNHFSVKVAPELMLYQYDAIVEKSNFRSPNTWEEAMSREHRRKFVQELAKNNAFDFIYW
jgi:hypothetical protein